MDIMTIQSFSSFCKEITIFLLKLRSICRYFRQTALFFKKFMGTHNEFGKQGEEMAANYLVKKGYLIICRNYRYLKAEIDIIAQKGNTVAIIEVKSRSSAYFENIAETVSKKKIGLLLSATDNFIKTKELDRDVRFDIITILKQNDKFVIEHFEDAFYHF